MNSNEIITLIIVTIAGLIYGAIKNGIHTYISDATKKFLNTFLHKQFNGNELSAEFDSIYERLVEIKTILNADRVFIDNFHNGSNFLPNRPIWRMTRTYEITASGVSYTTKDMQNILAISIWDMISPLFDSKQKKYAEKLKGDSCENSCKSPFGVYRIQVNKMSETLSKLMLRNQGVNTILIIPIIQNGENIVGFLGIHFMDENENKFNVCEICQKVQEIEYFLNKG